MNHLAHFHLAAPQPELIVGNLLGDYVKGPLSNPCPHNFHLGIKLHRAVDGYTDRHAIVRRSHRRFDREFRRYAPLMTDIIFDHFLARCWAEFHEVPLARFHDEIFLTIDGYRRHLPDAARRWLDHMAASRALVRHRHPVFVHKSFVHLSKRLTRSNPLADGFEQFRNHEDGLEADFREFYPGLRDFVRSWKLGHGSPS